MEITEATHPKGWKSVQKVRQLHRLGLELLQHQNNKHPSHAPTTQNTIIPPLGPTSYFLKPTLLGGTYQGCSFTDTYAATSPLHIPIPPRSAIDVLPRMHEATVSRKGRGARADILTGGNAAGPEMVAYGDCVRQQPPASGFSLVARGVISIPLSSRKRGKPSIGAWGDAAQRKYSGED